MRIMLMTNTAEGRYGYSVVGHELSKGLRDAGHDVVYFGLQELHPPMKVDNIVYLGIRYDAFGGDILQDYLRAYKIDCLMEMMDVWLDQLQYVPQVTKAMNTSLVTHVTVNTSPLSPFLTRFLVQSDYVICPSKFVYNEVIMGGIKTACEINHGVDLDIYKPMPNEKDETKKKLKIEDKKFVLLTVMRNKSPLQKNFPALFQAWKSMLISHPELQKNGVLLCLTDPLEIGSTRLDMLRDRTGLKDFVKFIWAKPTKDYSSIELTYEGDPNGLWHNANINFSAEEMAKLYNVADVFAVSSYGESFNLPCLESMACGIPQINCNHTTGPELVGIPKAGLLADVIATMTNPLITDSWVIDPNSLTKCIDTLYTDDKLRKECGKNALEHAKNYSWKKIMPEWLKLFNIVESDRMNVEYNKMRLGI